MGFEKELFPLAATVPEVVVVSPHLDDAVLSIGALIGKLAAEGRQVEVWTVFTRGPEVIPRDKKRRVFSDYQTRHSEDQRALKRLGARHRWLDFSERIWCDPPLSSVSQVFRTPDLAAAFANLGAIKGAIRQALAGTGTRVYAPLGVGNHYDHVAVALAALQVLIEDSAFERLVFYEDFYALGSGCRRRHFLTRRQPWSPFAAPGWTSPTIGALLAYTAWSAHGPGIESYLPEATNLTWSPYSEPAEAYEPAKFQALSEYRSQVDPFGGIKPLTSAMRRFHKLCKGEPLWRAELPTKG